MFCSKCGAEIPEGAQWCPNCGAQQSTPTQTLQRPESQTQTAPGSVAGFILSLAGFLADWVPVAGLVLSIIGTVICGKGKKQVAANPAAYTNTGLLTAGHIIGIIGIVCGAIYLVIWLIYALIFGGGTLMLFDFIKDMSDL
ncbi:MAG: zinc-ribbon domain-containing protein [Bacteroidales bacterium]|nr:zinc-ribbon domain-containing protein [Bacteroidales bacterium]